MTRPRTFTAITRIEVDENDEETLRVEQECCLASDVAAFIASSFVEDWNDFAKMRERAEAAERELQRLEDCIREYEGRACCTKWINNARHRPECQWAAAERERDEARAALAKRPVQADAQWLVGDELQRLQTEVEHLKPFKRIVTAPSDLDMVTIIVALREKGIMPGKRHLYAALSAVADLALAKETTL